MPKYAVSIPVVCVVSATIETENEDEVKELAQELDFSLTLKSNSLENDIELESYDTFADRQIIDGNIAYCELTEMKIEEIED